MADNQMFGTSTKKFSLRNLDVRPQVVSPIANDIGQLIQISANAVDKYNAIQTAKQEEVDNKNYYDANIYYRQQTMKLQTQLREAGEDLSKQRAVLDAHNATVASIGDDFNLANKHRSSLTSVIENDFTRRESVYNNAYGEQRKSIAQANTAEVVANIMSLEPTQQVTTLAEQKKIQESEGFTSEQASTNIARDYVNTVYSSMSKSMPYVQALTLYNNTKDTLLSFDDKLKTQPIYKESINFLRTKIDQIRRVEEGALLADKSNYNIGVTAFDRTVDIKLAEGVIETKEEADLYKQQHREVIAHRNAFLIGEQEKAEKKRLTKDQEQQDIINNQWKGFIETYKFTNTPDRDTPPDTFEFMVDTLNDKGYDTEANMKLKANYSVAWNMAFNPDKQLEVIKSNSLLYSGSPVEDEIKRNLNNLAKGAFIQGNNQIVELIYNNHGVAPDMSDVATQQLSSENPAEFAVRGQELINSNRPLYEKLFGKDNTTRIEAYSFVTTIGEDGKPYMSPDAKRTVDELLNSQATLTLPKADMNAFTTYMVNDGSLEYANKSREYILKRKLGIKADTIINGFKQEDMFRYKADVGGIDLRGAPVSPVNIPQDELKKVHTILRDVTQYDSITYNPTTQEYYAGRDGDRFYSKLPYKSYDELSKALKIKAKQMKKEQDKQQIETAPLILGSEADVDLSGITGEGAKANREKLWRVLFPYPKGVGKEKAQNLAKYVRGER